MAHLRPLRILACIAGVVCLAGRVGAGDLDLKRLAECIADSGAVFYGAHWCPGCEKQKEYFGRYASRLPYVECYAGTKSDGMKAKCRRAGVESFPTWHYPDGTIATGAKSPERLARATGCL